MTNQIRPYEPLTSENAALVLVDHQVGLMTGVRDYSTGELKHNVVAMAKAAKALKLPIVVTTTARDSMWGPTFPELVEALPGVEIIDRSSVNAFDDARGSRHRGDRPQEADLRRHLSRSLRGFSGHHCHGQGAGRICGGRCLGNLQCETKRQVGLLRMLQAGVILSDYATLMVEILKDNARPEAGEVYGAMDMPWAKLVGQIAQVYGK
jgi:hypothetical protein